MTCLGNIFPDYEKCLYSIKLFKTTDQVEEIGTMETELQKQPDNIKISSIIKLFNKDLIEKTQVLVDKSTFTPTLYNAELLKGETTVRCEGEYKKNKLIILVESDKKKKKFKMPLSGLYFDNSSIFYLARAFAFNQLKEHNFNTINVMYSVSTPAELSISEEEIVKLENKEYCCVGVKLDFESDNEILSQKLLYDKNHPNLLVKNVLGPQIIELKESKFASVD